MTNRSFLLLLAAALVLFIGWRVYSAPSADEMADRDAIQTCIAKATDAPSTVSMDVLLKRCRRMADDYREKWGRDP